VWPALVVVLVEVFSHDPAFEKTLVSVTSLLAFHYPFRYLHDTYKETVQKTWGGSFLTDVALTELGFYGVSIAPNQNKVDQFLSADHSLRKFLKEWGTLTLIKR
jgi:hypothetical protein